MKGIDVSFSQGNIDWRQVKTSGKADFAIIRSGYGKYASQKDEYFERNYAGCKDNSIPVGAYWYSYATTPDEAKLEAEVCVSILRGKQFEYPIWFDLEERSALNTGKANCSAMIRAFCEVLEKAGYWVGLYTSRSVLGTHIEDDIKTRYAIWAAEWNSKLNYSGTVGIWQYSDKGRVDGISGNVDLNECYIDYAKLVKEKGFNGFTKPEPEPEPLPYAPGMTPADIARIPYIAGMTAADVQTYIRWVTCKGAGDFPDTEDGFRAFLNGNR